MPSIFEDDKPNPLKQQSPQAVREYLKAFYLDWVNNYLTIETMADHYHVSDVTCSLFITLGRGLHEEDVG